MTDLRQAEPGTREGFEKWAKSLPYCIDLSRFEAGYSDCNTDYAWVGWQAALAQPQQQDEPSQWRDMVVVSLVREGIDKHKARELADHFAAQQQAKMRMPKVGDKVICLEDESLGEVVSLTAGGSPDITFDDGSRGTYLLREFAELFGYVAAQGDKTSFTDWWNGDYDDSENRFEKDSAAYWSWAGWQAAQRQWVGLTDEDVNRESAPIAQQMKLAFHAGMYVAQKILKEKNSD